MKTTAKLTEQQIRQIKILAEQGYMDSEIAKMFGNVTSGCIWYHRKRLNIKTQFNYEKVSKVDHSLLIELFNSGLSDYKIANKLGIRPCTVFSYRKYNNIGLDRNLKYNQPIVPSQFQRELIIGSIFGDSCMRKTNTNPSLICAHGIKQKEYCEYKTSLLSSLGAKCQYNKRKSPDKRNGNMYEEYRMTLPANPALLDIYDAFYPNGKKVLPLNLLNEYSAVSMAFHYMDDGYKMKSGYAFATNCFDRESLNIFIEMLDSKFGIKATLWKKVNAVYIKHSSQEQFKALVEPYFCDCMKYKL